VTDPSNVIDISDLDKAVVLTLLFNNAAPPTGMGTLQGSASDVLTYDEAVDILKGKTAATPYLGMLFVDYLKGRRIRTNLSANTIDPKEYDSINGAGATQNIINALRDSFVAHEPANTEGPLRDMSPENVRKMIEHGLARYDDSGMLVIEPDDEPYF
jgi:hypothetical protein